LSGFSEDEVHALHDLLKRLAWAVPRATSAPRPGRLARRCPAQPDAGRLHLRHARVASRPAADL